MACSCAVGRPGAAATTLAGACIGVGVTVITGASVVASAPAAAEAAGRMLPRLSGQPPRIALRQIAINRPSYVSATSRINRAVCLPSATASNFSTSGTTVSRAVALPGSSAEAGSPKAARITAAQSSSLSPTPFIYQHSTAALARSETKLISLFQRNQRPICLFDRGFPATPTQLPHVVQQTALEWLEIIG